MQYYAEAHATPPDRAAAPSGTSGWSRPRGESLGSVRRVARLALSNGMLCHAPSGTEIMLRGFGKRKPAQEADKQVSLTSTGRWAIQARKGRQGGNL